MKPWIFSFKTIDMFQARLQPLQVGALERVAIIFQSVRLTIAVRILSNRRMVKKINRKYYKVLIFVQMENSNSKMYKRNPSRRQPP